MLYKWLKKSTVFPFKKLNVEGICDAEFIFKDEGPDFASFFMRDEVLEDMESFFFEFGCVLRELLIIFK